MSKKVHSTSKIVLIGDARVGKTSLVRRFVTNFFDPSYQITLGTTIMKKEVEYLNNIVTLAIWDIGGQDVFRQIRSKYFFGSSGALAVCDASNIESFESLPTWVDSFKQEVGDKPIVFLANKCDLKDLAVTEEDMNNLIKKYKNTEFLFTSAKDGTNAEKAFINLVRLIISEEDVI
ncbi:MAG: Rab family GTPase [Candidatus Heimdallarchaeaceae archaeon]